MFDEKKVEYTKVHMHNSKHAQKNSLRITIFSISNGFVHVYYTPNNKCITSHQTFILFWYRNRNIQHVFISIHTRVLLEETEVKQCWIENQTLHDTMRFVFLSCFSIFFSTRKKSTRTHHILLTIHSFKQTGSYTFSVQIFV